MWRALFLACGVYLMILGVECLGVETFNLKARKPPPAPVSPFDPGEKVGPRQSISPAPWTPWTMLSVGALVCLYSFTLPRYFKSG